MATPDPGLDNQAGVRSTLRLAGWVALGIGIVLTGIALIDFFSAFGRFEQPRNFWMGFIGLPLVTVGTWMLKAGYIGPATRYVAGEVTPTLHDAMGQLGIGAGADQQVCASCGGRNAADAKFCDDCGTALRRACASCGADNAGDAKFCDDCGAALAG
jgi:ribosomal protein L40E